MITRHAARIARRRPAARATFSVGCRAWLLMALAAGCVPLEQLPPGLEAPFSISMIAPPEDSFIPPGGTVRIQWIDVGMEPGALVYLKSVSTDENGDQAEVDILARRDASADDAADHFDWNGTDAHGNPMPARIYQIFGVLENPDGRQDIRSLRATIAIPFEFLGMGAGGKKAILTDNSGNGPFILQDNDADFLEAGVRAGDTARVFGGSGSVLGSYLITKVAETQLTLQSSAGDSGGEDDVRYLVPLNNPSLPDVESLVTIAWRDAEYASNSTITLEIDPDTDPDNDNQTPIREGLNLEPDGNRDLFAWDGTDTEGGRVPTGLYYLRAVLNRGAVNQLTYLLTDNRVSVGGVEPTLALTQPSSDATPDPGGTVHIAWTDSDPDDDATITLLADPDTDLLDPTHDSGNELEIETDISEDNTGDSFNWNTSGTALGTYTIVGRIQDGQGHSAVSSAPGRVTLQNSPPVVEWIRPEGDSADADDNNENGPFRFIDTAANFTADFGGNVAVRNLVFGGNDLLVKKRSNGVFQGVYPIAEDPTSATELVLASNPGDSDGAGNVQYRITGDISLRRGTSPLFEFKTHDPEEASTFDLYLDFDDQRNNGNEILILEDRAVPQNDQAQDDTFTWTLTRDVNNNTVDPGNYRLFAELDDGNPRGFVPIAEFEGRILLRTGVGEPAISLTDPASDAEPELGSKVQIAWQDQDTDSGATITLRYDDDPLPNETDETDGPEVDLHPGVFIDADQDDGGGLGWDDTFQWDWHPDPITEAAVGQGEYYLFAYIGDNGGDPAGNPDMIAMALGKVTIPNTPPELEFTVPGAANAEFDSDDGLDHIIAWNLREPDADDSVTIDLWLDANDTFTQDLARDIQLADNYTGGSPFAWNGLDRFGTPVETGQYRVIAALHSGDDDVLVDDTPGLINWRPDTSTAVINIASQFDVSQGNKTTQEGTLQIRWRAVLVSGSEFVELYYDDDASAADDLGTLIETDLTTTPNQLNAYTWELDTGVPANSSPGYHLHARLVEELAAGTTAELSNGGGGGPFVLTDAGGDFVNDGASAGDEVRILSGTGATAGSYLIAGGGVTATTLTLTTDAGDSGGSTDVAYRLIRQLDTSTSQGTVEVGTGVEAGFDFLQPVSTRDVVTTVDTVNIIWEYTTGEAGTVTLKVDPDATNNNGNEITILNNRLQAAAPTGAEDNLNWDLKDLSPADVPTGEYFVRGVFNVPGSSLINDQADGAVKIRKSAAAPLVKLTQPNTNKNYGQGDDPVTKGDIQITWTVDDIPPNTAVKVDIWFDREQSPEPDAGVLADGADFTALVGDGSSAGAVVEDIDASQGAYTWLADEIPQYITATANKTYYIHIRIRDGAAPADDDRATAVGKIVVGN